MPTWFSSMKAAFCSFPTCAELGHQKEKHRCITTLIGEVKFPPSVRFLFLPSGSIWPSTCNSMKEMSRVWTLKLSSAICSSIYQVTLFSYGTIPPYIGVSWLRNTYKNIQDFWLKSSLAMRQNLIPLSSFGPQADYELSNTSPEDVRQLKTLLSKSAKRLSKSQKLLWSCIYASDLPWTRE